MKTGESVEKNWRGLDTHRGAPSFFRTPFATPGPVFFSDSFCQGPGQAQAAGPTNPCCTVRILKGNAPTSAVQASPSWPGVEKESVKKLAGCPKRSLK